MTAAGNMEHRQHHYQSVEGARDLRLCGLGESVPTHSSVTDDVELHGSAPFTALPSQLNAMTLFSLAFQVYAATHFSYWG
jgi:hypothetical protein